MSAVTAVCRQPYRGERAAKKKQTFRECHVATERFAGAAARELGRKATLVTLAVLLLGVGAVTLASASSSEVTMAESNTPPRQTEPPAHIPPPPPYQPDPTLITYIEKGRRPGTAKRDT